MNVEIRVGDVVEAHAPFGRGREIRECLRAEKKREEDDAATSSSLAPIGQ